MPGFDKDVVIVGGCGHVGLPLGIAFADRGLSVSLYDVNEQTVAAVNGGQMPFTEAGAEERLAAVLAAGRLEATTDPTSVRRAENVVVVIGTPVDEHLNPDPHGVPKAIERLTDHLADGQLMVLRSTVYPGVTALVERLVAGMGRKIDVTFCPERIAEGKAMVELYQLPQIISGRTECGVARARRLFEHLTEEILELEPEEAELAKLFTNTWRYIKFATANQLYMIANDRGLDYERIRHAVTWNYPRAADMPRAGLAAGPCLFKDTMQLAAFNNNNFTLGHASMMINEGLPLYVVARLEQHYDLASMTVGLLGMAFKPESEDIRSSLSYKLKRILRFKANRVLTTDPFVTVDPDLTPLADVVAQSDLLIIATPHQAYANLQAAVPVVDVQGFLGQGVRV